MILAVVRKMILRLSSIYAHDRVDLILQDAGDTDDTRFFFIEFTFHWKSDSILEWILQTYICQWIMHDLPIEANAEILKERKNYISNTKITCLCIVNWPQNIRLLILIPNKRICSGKCSRSLRIISHTIYHFRFELESHIAAFRRSGHPPTLLTRWSLDLRWSPGAIGVVRSGLWRGARGGWEELAARTRKEDSKLVSPVRALT